jgi:hypothetical protein
MGRWRRAALSAAADGAGHDERLGGVAVAILVLGLAAADGGFTPLGWNRALLAVAALVAVQALVAGVERPGRDGGILIAALALLAAWTALSWFWSDSPPRALLDAQRVTLYAAVAAAVLLCRRRVPAWSIALPVVVIAWWNLLSGPGTGTGAGSAPIGYSNALALLCVLGLVLLPACPRLLWLPALALPVVLVRQDSLGAVAALAAAIVVYAVRSPRLRLLVVALAIGLLLAAPFVGGGHERDRYWRVAAREAEANAVLGGGAGTFTSWWLRERTVPYSTLEAHSLYVETVAELGPIGLALVLTALAVPIARTRRRELAAVVAAFAVGATVDFDWELAAVTVPAVAAAALAVADVPRRPLRLGLVLPVAAAVGIAAWLASLGNARLADAQHAARRGDFAVAAERARAAGTWMPWSPEPWLVLGDVTNDPAAYREAVRRDPRDWDAWQRLAAVAHGRLRRLAEARAAQLNPLGVTSER